MVSTKSTAYSYHPYGNRTSVVGVLRLLKPVYATGCWAVLAVLPNSTTRDSENVLEADKTRPGFVEISLREAVFSSALAPHLRYNAASIRC